MKGSGDDVIMKEFILENWKYAFWILFCSGFVFEIAPIKFSPISTFLGWLGKKLNRDVKKDILQLQTDIKSVKSDLQCHKIESQRRDILNFADKIMRGEQKTKENFDSIIKSHDEYEIYIKQHNIENGQITLAFEYISDKYKECRDSNSFYTGK